MASSPLLLAMLLRAADPDDAPPPPAMPALEDVAPPAVPGLGLSSPRLALPVTVRFADDITPMQPITGRTSGKAGAPTPAPVNALSRHALPIARHFFEEARWGTEKDKGKGRELVIRGITVLSQQGPMYEVQLMVDRYENGKRLGQGTGQGHAVPDRTNDRMAAAFAPGLIGLAASQDANRPKARKDAPAIAQATLLAWERAVMPLGAYWAAEQAAEEARRKK